MTGKDIFMAVGQADDRFIAELMEEKPARRRTALPWAAAAGLLAAAALALVLFGRSGTSGGEADPAPDGSGVLPTDGFLIPALPAYPEGDYYSVSYIVRNETPKIDFPALFEAVLAGGGEAGDVEELIAVNGEAWEALMSHGDETLFYSLCYAFQHSDELDGGADTADLAFHIVRLRLRGEALYAGILREPSETSTNADQCRRMFRATVAQYMARGNDWAREASPAVYQVLRAMVSVPELRFLATGCTGETVNARAVFNATRAFTWDLTGRDAEALGTLANDTLPEPPEGVCDEYTLWTLTQDADGRVRLEFTDSATGAFKGAMTYTPSKEELTLVPDADGDLTENDAAPAAGLLEVEYPE